MGYIGGELALKLISSYWETERLFVRDAVLDTDLDGLQKLWESTAYIGEYDGHPERKEDDMYRDLTEGDLPPNGSKDRFKVQSIFSKVTSEMVGYMTLYQGYPDNKTVWLTFFYIGVVNQARGFGQEIISQFALEAKTAGFRRLMLQVALKNWGAIRFWTKAGFNKITGFYGDKTYGNNTFANLALEKSLD
jgi:ribosomal protein S18 acetylase RimI-like enzyme